MSSEDSLISTKYLKRLDVRSKLILIKYILNKCKEYEETQSKKNFSDVYSAISHYTNTHIYTVTKTLANTSKTIDFKVWSEENEKPNEKILHSNEIFNLIYKKYVIDRVIPKVEDVCALAKIDKKKALLTLKHNNFIWKMVHNTDKCLLVEEPEQQARRIEYLLKSARCREELRNFFYIDEKEVTTIATASTESKTERVFLLASSNLGLLDVTFANSGTPLNDWMKDTVYQYLNPKDVLIYEHDLKDFTIVPPRPESTKKEMMDWLDNHTVSYSTEMSRAELYKLIELFCDNTTKCPRDEVLKAKGITVLRRPDWPELDYFNTLCRRVELLGLYENISGVKCLVKDQFISTIELFTIVDDWRKFHNNLAVSENEVYEKDMLLEEVIDKILTMAKYFDDLTGIPESLLNVLSENNDEGLEKYDCIITEKWKEDDDDS